MGVSTNAQLCFGVALPEIDDDLLPWHTEDNWDVTDWWRKLNGCPQSDVPWDIKEGDMGYFSIWPDGRKVTDLERKSFYDQRDAWDREHPCPVEEVSHCSDDYPMYILAVPGTVTVARRGYTETIECLPLVSAEKLLPFYALLQKHVAPLIEDWLDENGEIDTTEWAAHWILSSFWG